MLIAYFKGQGQPVSKGKVTKKAVCLSNSIQQDDGAK